MRCAVIVTGVLVAGICCIFAGAALAAPMPATQPSAEMSVRFDYPRRLGASASEGTSAVEVLCNRLYAERYGDKPRLLTVRRERESKGLYQQLTVQCENPDGKEFLDVVARHLEKLAAERAAAPEDRLRAELEQVQSQLDAMSQKQMAIMTIRDTQARVAAEAGFERMKSLELERQRLTMDLAAKEARGGAVREQIKMVQDNVDRKVGNDAVIEQLRKVVELKKKEVQMMRDMQKSGNATPAEVTAKEMAVAEAEARVAERSSAVSESANAELLNRLAEEVATLAIDQAEMNARLKMVTEQLPPEDLSKLDEKDLARLSELYVAPSTERRNPPLFLAIESQKAPLLEKKLGLVISNLKIER